MAQETYEITVEKLVYGGDGLGRLPDGRAVFVPRVLPGETVEIELTESGQHVARAQPSEIRRASPDRIGARCKHFGECGGCHYQHIPYEKQVQLKGEILRDQLRRLAGLDDPPVGEPVAASAPWNYRNRVQFQVTTAGQMGFVRAGEQDGGNPRVLAIDECHLPTPAIDEAWPNLNIEGNSGVSRVWARSGHSGELMVVLEASKSELPELETEAGVSVIHLFEGDSIVLAGSDHVTVRALNKDFRVSARSFFQVNIEVAELMIGHVLRMVNRRMGTMIDAYAGVGLFSRFLAPLCDHLIAIESLASACDDFSVNLDEFENVELYEDAVENVLASLQLRPDLILLDPPRAGLTKETLDGIRRLRPATLIYVSCDPATLARDTKRLLGAGYTLNDSTLFDMFPQTYHIESISTFTHSGAEGPPLQ